MWRYEAEQGDGGNPYTPKNRLIPEPRARLPEARLRRLGVGDNATLALYRAWWDGLGGEIAQARAVQALAVLDDGQLAAQASQLGGLAKASAAHIEAWARRQPNREVAAGLALVAERSRAQPRPGVIKKLTAIR